MEVPLARVDIADASDPRVAAYTSVRERDLSRGGQFIGEGENVLRVLLGPRSNFRVTSLFLSEPRARTLDSLVGRLDVPVYVAPQPVMDQVVGFPIHRGVLAVAERGPERSAAALLDDLGPGPKQILVLSQLANHDNVGGIFRNAAAFGVDAVLLDETTCDPLYRKSIRVSVGGALVVPFVQAPIGEILHALEGRDFTVYGLSPRGAADLRALRPPPRFALMLGAEGPGLPGELLARTTPVRIDMAPGFDSLNVSVTSGIALFALGQGR